MKKLYFHIGYPKTATTFLQNYFFKSFEEINYIDLNNHEFFYFNDPEKNLNLLIENFCKEINIKYSRNKTNVISNEIFLEPLVSQKKGEKMELYTSSIDKNFEIIYKLKDFLKSKYEIETCFFFTIRDNISILTSYFLQLNKSSNKNKIFEFHYLENVLKNEQFKDYELYNNIMLFFNYDFVFKKYNQKFRIEPKYFIYKSEKTLFDNYLSNISTYLIGKKYIKKNELEIKVNYSSKNKITYNYHNYIKKNKFFLHLYLMLKKNKKILNFFKYLINLFLKNNNIEIKNDFLKMLKKYYSQNNKYFN